MKISIYNKVTGELLFTNKNPFKEAETIAQELGFDKDFIFIEKDASILFDIIDEVKEEKSNMYESTKEQPKHIGDIETPTIGDLIYIPSYKSFLRTIIGGVGTVCLVNETGSNLMVEVDKAPGIYFNWNEIKEEQEELSKQFGFNSASLIK